MEDFAEMRLDSGADTSDTTSSTMTFCEGVNGSAYDAQFAKNPDRRSRRLALYANGLNYCNTKSSPCCVMITGWKNVTLEQFKSWELHTLIINQGAFEEDFAVLMRLLSANPSIVKLVAAACHGAMILEIASITQLKYLEITYGSNDSVRCYTTELINNPVLSSVVSCNICCPGQQFLTDLSFVKRTTQSIMCEAPGGVIWNCVALNHILKMFCDGSALNSMCLLLDNYLSVTAFKHLVLKDISYKEEHLHGVNYSDYFTIRSSTGIGFIEWKPHEFHFQLLDDEKALTEHKKFIVHYYSNVLQNEPH